MGLFSDMVALSKTVFASETNFSSSQLLDGRELPIPNHKFYWHWNFFETPQKLINDCHQLTDDFATSGNWRPTPSFSLARSWFESLGWVTTQAMASKTGKLAKYFFQYFSIYEMSRPPPRGYHTGRQRAGSGGLAGPVESLLRLKRRILARFWFLGSF